MFDRRIFFAEAIGTAILLAGGPGTAVLTTGRFPIPEHQQFVNTGVSVGVLGVALAFGFALLISAYAVGPVSGCHINPAVTLGLWLNKKIPGSSLLSYFSGQLIGCLAGAATIAIIANSQSNFDINDKTFAVNGWGNLSPGGFGFGAMVVVELVFTALLVFAVLSTTHRNFSPAAIGLTVGLTLTLIHLVTIPVDNTSVNPARSIGMAVFAGGDALQQLWAFILFPMLGGVLGWVAWRLVAEPAEPAPVG